MPRRAAVQPKSILNQRALGSSCGVVRGTNRHGLSIQTIGSVGAILVDQLGIDYSRVGTLIGLYLLPGMLIALPGGLLGQRFGARIVCGIGLLLMAAGGLMAGAGTSFYLIATGRFVSGAGAVLMNVMATKMVADWFIDRKLTTAMAILVASWPFGIGLGLVVEHAIAIEAGWSTVMDFAAAMSLSCSVLIFAVCRNPPQRSLPVSTIDRRPNLTGYELRLILIAGSIWAIYIVGYIVLISFAPEFFAVRGYSQTQSNWIVSLLGWLLIPMVAIGGLLSQATGRPSFIIASGLILTVLAAIVLPFVSTPATLFVLISLVAGLPAGPIMSLPATVLQPENRAVGMGAFFTCYYAGMAVLPVIAGEVRDITGSPTGPILFAAGILVCSLLLLIVFRALERPAQTAGAKQGRAIGLTVSV